MKIVRITELVNNKFISFPFPLQGVAWFPSEPPRFRLFDFYQVFFCPLLIDASLLKIIFKCSFSFFFFFFWGGKGRRKGKGKMKEFEIIQTLLGMFFCFFNEHSTRNKFLFLTFFFLWLRFLLKLIFFLFSVIIWKIFAKRLAKLIPMSIGFSCLQANFFFSFFF